MEQTKTTKGNNYLLGTGYLAEILGISSKVLRFSFEILGISKIFENRIPYTHVDGIAEWRVILL